MVQELSMFENKDPLKSQTWANLSFSFRPSKVLQSGGAWKKRSEKWKRKEKFSHIWDHLNEAIGFNHHLVLSSHVRLACLEVSLSPLPLRDLRPSRDPFCLHAAVTTCQRFQKSRVVKSKQLVTLSEASNLSPGLRCSAFCAMGSTCLSSFP